MFLNDRKFLRTISLAMSLPTLIFLVLIGSIVLYSFGIRSFEGLYSFITGGVIGYSLLVMSALCATVLVSSLVWSRVLMEKRRKIRYMIASYIHHSKARSGQKIPIRDISRVIGSDPRDVEIALEVMIERKEIRGSIDQKKGIYKHMSVGRKGRNLRFLIEPLDNDMIKGTIVPEQGRR